jgi:tyrosinase
LYDDTRNINDGSALPSPVVLDDLNNALSLIPFPPNGFFGFSPSLEGSPHGAVHVLIGGNMGFVPTAANDPVFWLHHGNIDRVWDQWISRGEGRMNPSDDAFLNTPYSFADESGNTVNLQVRDIMSSEQLGYRYDDVPPPAAAAMRSARRFAATAGESHQPTLIGSSHAAPPTESKPLGFKPETVKLEVLPQQSETLRAAAETTRPGQPSKILLQIEGLSLADVPSFTYGVYLNLPEGDVPADQARLHHVGTINFFGRGPSGKASHEHGKDQTFTETLDATATVVRLKRFDQWKPDALSVTLRPISPIPPMGQEELHRKRSEESAARAKIHYQRINLLVTP